MGKRSDFAARPQDQYLTPFSAVEPLARFLGTGRKFYEPCAGDGRLVEHLEALGHTCTGYSDIDPEGARMLADAEYGGAVRTDVAQRDAFDITDSDLNGADVIITNPPWSRSKASGYLLHRLIEHFTKFRPTWFLCDADWIHTKQASPYMQYLTHIVSIGRVKWIPDSNSTGKDNACWYGFVNPDLRTSPHPMFYGRI